MRLWILAWLVTLLTAGCGPGPDHYAAVLDELAISPTWELVYITVNSPGGADIESNPGVPRKLTDCAIGDCPAVARFYLVSDEPVDILAHARQNLVDNGFEVRQEFETGCDRPQSGVGCGVIGAKDGDQVWVSIFHPGEDPAGLGIADPDRSMVRALAQRE